MNSLLFAMLLISNCLWHISSLKCKNGDPIQKTGVSEQDKQKILAYHNALRNKVAAGKVKAIDGYLPRASNMRKMVWDDKLAEAAQVHTNYCQSKHFWPFEKIYGASYGQNIYENWTSGSMGPPDWKSTVQKWFNEVTLFPVSRRNPFRGDKSTDHFTQVIWAETTRIGCGYTEFVDNRPDFFQFPNSGLYTCNYMARGNINTLQVYASGVPCSKCTCDKIYTNLCV